MKFTLQPQTWQAMEYLFPSGERHFSPIWIFVAEPGKAGDGWLDLDFWHANYAEGVQRKRYAFRVVAREAGWLFGLRNHGGARAGVILSAITPEWMREHFPQLASALRKDEELGTWLDRALARPNDA